MQLASFVRGLAWCACLTACAWIAPSRADEPLPADGLVAGVRVRGTHYIEEDAVLARIGMRAGEPLTAEKVRRDLASVFGTGFFEDVQVLRQDTPEGVVVIFQVVEKPAVTDVRIEGNKKIDDEDLTALLDIRSFGVLNQAKVQKTVQSLRDKYVEKGFYLAEIEPEIIEVADDRVEVVFHITENRKVIVQRIAFTGNDHVADREFKKYMQTKEGGFAPWLTNRGTFDRDKVEGDQQVVQYVMLENGYLDAKVDPPHVYLSPDKRFIYVSFHITEGPQYEIDEVSVHGDFVAEEGLNQEDAMRITHGVPVADIQMNQWRINHGKRPMRYLKSRRGIALEKGDTFKYSDMEAIRANLTRFWGDQGYAFGTVVAQPMPDPATKTADIAFVVQKGEKMRVGHINIVGNDPTFDKVIRREVLLNEGDVYRGSLMDASRFRLMRTGFFQDVAITTPKGDEPDKLDVNVKVTEKPTGSFSLGLGYSSVAKLQLNASIQKNNFLGLGYNLNAQVQWSKLQRNINVAFFDPRFLDSKWTLSISGFWMEQRYQLNQYRRGGSIGLGRYLDRQNSLTLSLFYSLQDVGLLSLDAYRQRLYGGELFRNGLTSEISLSLTLDRRNNQIQATKGFYLTGTVTLAGGFRVGDRVVSLFGGDFNFVQAQLNFRFYQPLIPNSDWLVFRFNSSLGAIWSTDGRIVPYIQRYRAGGINSMRGFYWYSLGPQVRMMNSDDPTSGDTSINVGGTQSWINNIELQAPIVRSAGISAVAFFDVGNAFGGPQGGGINLRDLRTSAGFGIRWQSPIGPLRFELGFPLRPREGEKHSQFAFSIGNFF